MTCFWDSILTCLNNDDFIFLGHTSKLNREQFIYDLKNHNKLVTTEWCGSILKNQEKNEHFQAIKNYNVKGIYNGHLTSICDSFLLLISDLFRININHRFINTNISYSVSNPRKTLSFTSDHGHFSILYI